VPSPSSGPGEGAEGVSGEVTQGDAELEGEAASPAQAPSTSADAQAAGARAVAPTSTPASAPVIEGDWLASVCPFVTSEDGTYRSGAPDEGHRCTAQDPAATLPLAFQERYCLTDQHPRCEMYKFAQETNASGAIPVAQVPPTDPPTPHTRRSDGSGPSRPLIVGAAGLGAIALLLILLVGLMGSCSDGSDTPGDDGASPDPQASGEPAATPEPTATPTPEPEATPTPEPDPDATPAPTDEAEVPALIVLYEIQEGEALLKVSQTFGVTRNRIRKANPGLEEIAPADLPGTVIEIPLPAEMTIEEVEVLPGYQGILP
jgi:hypothetical protein